MVDQGKEDGKNQEERLEIHFLVRHPVSHPFLVLSPVVPWYSSSGDRTTKNHTESIDLISLECMYKEMEKKKNVTEE